MRLKINKGGCLPAEHIMEGADGLNGHWGDTTIKLGWNIGILATELHMLGDVKKYAGFGWPEDYRNATIELYCALAALERLDFFGETALWQDHYIRQFNLIGSDILPYWPGEQGFFIRDDVDGRTMFDMGFQDGDSDYAFGGTEIKDGVPVPYH